MTSNLKVLCGYWSHYLQRAGHVVLATPQAAQLVMIIVLCYHYISIIIIKCVNQTAVGKFCNALESRGMVWRCWVDKTKDVHTWQDSVASVFKNSLLSLCLCVCVSLFLSVCLCVVVAVVQFTILPRWGPGFKPRPGWNLYEKFFLSGVPNPAHSAVVSRPSLYLVQGKAVREWLTIALLVVKVKVRTFDTLLLHETPP